MDNLSIAQQNVARSHTFLDNLAWLLIKKVDLYVICEPPSRISTNEVNFQVYQEKDSRTMIIVLNSALRVEYIQKKSNIYVTTIHLTDHDITIHSVYIPPDQSRYYDQARVFVMKVFSSKSSRSLILGDINSTIEVSNCSRDTMGVRLYETFPNLGWVLLNDPSIPTRKKGNRSIDWSVASSTIAPNFSWRCTDQDKSLSDHCLIFLESNLNQVFPTVKEKSVTVDLSKFIDRMKKFPSDTLVEEFCACASSAIEDSIRVTQRKRKKPFYDEFCLQSKKDVNRLRRKVAKHGKRFPNLLEELKEASSRHSIMVKNAKERHWANRMKECKHLSDVDRLLKSTKIAQNHVINLIHDGRTVTDPSEVSQIALNHFYPNDDSTVSQLQNLRRSGERDPVITARELACAFTRQKTSTPGLDRMNLVVLLAIEKTFPKLILAVINRWHELEQLPPEMKRAKIILTLKKSNLAPHLANIRPVSMMNVLVKVYERIILARIEWTLAQKSINFGTQFAYKKGGGCSDVIREIQKNRLALKPGRDMIVSLDIRGAFNSMSHGSIIRKFISMGMSRSLVNVMIDYFLDRTVCCELDIGTIVEMNRGLPQGSVLAPFLFSTTYDVFVEYLQKLLCAARISAHVQVYCDDCIIVFERPHSDRIAMDIVTWLIRQANVILSNLGLSLNLSKTNVISNQMTWTIDDVTISSHERGRILGCVFEERIGFSEQINVNLEIVKDMVDSLKHYLKFGQLSLSIRLSLVKRRIHGQALYAAGTVFQRVNESTLKKLLAIDKSIAMTLFHLPCTIGYAATLIILGKNSLLYRMFETIERERLKYEEEFEIENETGKRGISDCHPADVPTITFKEVNCVEKLVHPKNLSLALFTDGSKSKHDSQVTSAFVTWSPATHTWEDFHFKLPSYASSYQAERHAMLKAVIYIYETCSHGVYHILCDSRSILQAMASIMVKDDVIKCIVNYIHRCLLEGKVIHLTWVKAHGDITGNIRADEACRDARDYYHTAEFVPRPKAHIGRIVEEYAREKTNTVAECYFKAAYDHGLVVDFSTALALKLKVHYWSAHFYANRIPTRHQQKRMGLSDVDTCDCGQTQTTRHILLFCPEVMAICSKEYQRSGLIDYLKTARKMDEVLSSRELHKFISMAARNLIKWLERTNGFELSQVQGEKGRSTHWYLMD